MSVTPEFKVALSGPFFTRDPGKTVRGNILDMMDALAYLTEGELRGLIASKPMPRSTGWTAAHVVGRTRNLAGKRWQVTAVISTSTVGMDKHDAIRTKAAAAGMEKRYHPYRQVKNYISRSRAVLGANLVKGLED